MNNEEIKTIEEKKPQSFVMACWGKTLRKKKTPKNPSLKELRRQWAIVKDGDDPDQKRKW